MDKIKAIILILLGSFFSCTDDVIQRLLAEKGFHPYQILHTRTFFAMIILSFFIIKNKLYKTKLIKVHILRGVLLCGTICFHILGLERTSLSLCALIEFTGPLFIIILSGFFLKEKVTKIQILVALTTFITVASIIDFKNAKITYGCFFVLIAMIIYGVVETINKKIIMEYKEKEITMIFYYNFFGFIIITIPSLSVYTLPALFDIMLFFLLGLGSVLYYFCFLKAFKLANISFLSPFKYSEFIYKNIFGLIIFNEKLRSLDFIAMGVIIIANIILLYKEKEKQQ